MTQFKIQIAAVSAVLAAFSLQAQFNGYTNLGLVGVGRVSPELFDQLGPNLDSLGGIGSAIFVDPGSITRDGDVGRGFTWSGILYSVPDRGFDGANRDYHPRLHTFSFAIAPYYGNEPTNQGPDSH